jgi:tellurite methyltransferase
VHSPLLNEHLGALIEASALGPIVDLACGSGRNGLFLARMGLPVVFADHSQEALDSVAHQLHAEGLPGETWQVDLEAGTGDPLAARRFSAALVFRYLHRPLMPHLRASILPGGLVVYETFTQRNTRYGRPHNPDFLLQPGELAELFAGWTTLHFFEGFLPDPDREVAQLVGRKPFE